MADETGLDFKDQIISLESKYQEVIHLFLVIEFGYFYRRILGHQLAT